MFKSIYKYIAVAGTLVSAILFAMFRSKAEKVEVLKEVNRIQEESIRVHVIEDEVTESIDIQLEEQVKEVKDKIKELKRETDEDSDVVMSSEFIRLLNENSIQD